MTISVNDVTQIKALNFTSGRSDNKKSDNKKEVSSKVVYSTLAAVGITALSIIALKKKGGKNNPSDIKKIKGQTLKVKDMTAEEKEKLIKELQAKTDNPVTKDEIRKLIENGEWDNL